MDGKLTKMDQAVYSFFEIKHNSNPNIASESNGMISSTTTSYTENPSDVGKIYFFDTWSNLQKSDANWALSKFDLLSEG